MKRMLLLDYNDLSDSRLEFKDNPDFEDFKYPLTVFDEQDIVIYQTEGNEFILLKNRYGNTGKLKNFVMNMGIDDWMFTLTNLEGYKAWTQQQ